MKNHFGIFMKIPVVLLAFSIALPGAAESGDEAKSSVVEVVAVHEHESNRHLFRISDDEPPSGWTRFRFTNASPVDHFMLIWRYPEEGIAAARETDQPLLEHWYDSVAMSFEGFVDYLDGKYTLEEFTDKLVNALESNAPWFLDPGAVPTGGPGFTAPGRTSTTTVFLEAGDYIVECYVRDENGVFHTEAGMLDHLKVSDDESGAAKPEAGSRVTISSEGGIVVEAPPVAGSNTIEIHYRNQIVHPHFLGHNVQLVRLQDKADGEALEAIAKWMDWRNPEGLVNRAPADARFMGGVMEMSEGTSGYLHVDLEPGDYAWIAEVPDPASQGMLKTFSIGD